MSVGAATLPPSPVARSCAIYGAEALMLKRQLPGLVENAPSLGFAASRHAGSAGGSIISVMTKLAGGEQVGVAAILNRIGAVRGRQGDAAAGARVRVAVPSIAAAAMAESAFPGALALPAGADEANAGAYLFPVGRVTAPVFRPDRHR